LDRELKSEIEVHLTMLTEEHMRCGSSPEEAKRLARIEFGGIDQLNEAHREVRGLPFVEVLLQDLRYAFRSLRHNAGFSVFTILIIGLGVGASATIFSVVTRLLIRPLPFADSKHLVWIANKSDDGLSEWGTQADHYLDLRAQNRSFSDLAAYFSFYSPGDAKLKRNNETEGLNSLRVSLNLFSFLGVQPFLGRTFTNEEAKSRWNNPGVVILSNEFWRRRFAAAPGVIGQTVTLNDRPVTIVGVLPQSFDFEGVFAPGNHFDVYLPMPMTPETNAWGNLLAVVGRLKPGVTIDVARSETGELAKEIESQHPERNTLRPLLTGLDEHVVGRLRRGVVVLAWAVGIVMLLVCTNVANLQMARGAARQKEMAVRIALGAGRHRLVRQLLTESIALSCCGGLIGIFLAIAGTRILAGLETFNIPLLSGIRVDSLSLIFSVMLALLTGLGFGLVPALQVPFSAVHESLKGSSRGSSATKKSAWIRNTLVVSEIVLTCMLLVGSGLLTRSFLNVLQVDLGFQASRAAAMRVDDSTSYSTRAERDNIFGQILDQTRSLPGVGSAGLTDVLPLAGDRSWAIFAKGKTYAPGHFPEGFIRIVSDGYFQAMGIPVIVGRTFTERDNSSSGPVVLVNETLARTIWPHQDPIGRILMCEGGGSPGRMVIGVVADVRHRGIERDSGCELYIPMRQSDDVDSVYLVVRTALPPSAIAGTIRAALHPIIPDLSSNEFMPVQELVDRAVSSRRFVVALVGGFSTFALILAALGIYAVIAYSVNQRTTELGVRMALGATVGNLQSQVLTQTLKLAGLGMLVGSIGAWCLSKALESLLFGVKSTDPATFLGMVFVLTVVACLAGYLPALRISKIDPMSALRAA
jgi:predicted permease